MDKIKQINSIFSTARPQTSKQSKTEQLHTEKKVNIKSRKKTKKISSNEIKKIISKKLKALDIKSENYTRQANRVFLESILLWEFGENIINAPEFHQMLEKINDTISSNNESSCKLSELIKQLTAD